MQEGQAYSDCSPSVRRCGVVGAQQTQGCGGREGASWHGANTPVFPVRREAESVIWGGLEEGKRSKLCGVRGGGTAVGSYVGTANSYGMRLAGGLCTPPFACLVPGR